MKEADIYIEKTPPNFLIEISKGIQGENGIGVPSGGTAGQFLSKNSNIDYDTTWSDIPFVANTLTFTASNRSGSTITKGSVVYINGAHGNLPTIALSQGNAELTSARTIGFVNSDILNNSTGVIINSGTISGLNTSSFSDGNVLYLSPSIAGGYTSTKPSAPNHMVYLGVITRSHPTLGSIEISIQNGFEIQELHDVAISSVSNDNVLQYESATSLWKNKALTKSSVGLSNVDNTSDSNKPVSTSTQNALNLKANLDGGNNFTGDQVIGGMVTANWTRIGAGDFQTYFDDFGSVTYMYSTYSISLQTDTDYSISVGNTFQVSSPILNFTGGMGNYILLKGDGDIDLYSTNGRNINFNVADASFECATTNFPNGLLKVTDTSGGEVLIGDYNGSINGTYIQISDASNEIIFNGGAVFISPISANSTTFLNTITLMAASTSSIPSFRVRPGANTSSGLASGDIWFDGTDLRMRIGATTKKFVFV